MSDLVIISTAQLEAMLERCAQRTVELLAAQTGEQWRRVDMAKHYKVSERTIDRWVKTGRIPSPGLEGCWIKAEVLRRDRERSGRI